MQAVQAASVAPKTSCPPHSEQPATINDCLLHPVCSCPADEAVQRGARANATAAESDEDAGLEVRPLPFPDSCFAKAKQLFSGALSSSGVLGSQAAVVGRAGCLEPGKQVEP